MMRQESYRSQDQAALYLVPTPIGNLDDMTYRAVKTLTEVDIILAEDTRHSIKLLNHFDIKAKLHSFHEHSRDSEADRWVDTLRQGSSIALISDAGMPLINDPGHPLVQKALEADIPVIALPGANAALTALVASGLPADSFSYYGFFPRKGSDQEEILRSLGQRQETAIFYESPYRIKEAIKQIVKVLGPDTPVVVGRELTKRYEEYLRGKAEELQDYLKGTEIKGECVLLIQGGSLSESIEEELEKLTYKEHVELLMAQSGLSPKEAIKEVARIHQVKKQVVYNDYHDLT